MDSRVEQGAQSRSRPQASPLAVDTAMRRPVKEPGPAATATTSTSSSDAPQLRSRLSAMGSRVRLWVRPLFCQDWATRTPSRHRATEQGPAEASRAKIFTGTPPRR